jgi:hypothetical protein
MLSPEAYSNDPEVFTRTLLTQELDDFFNKVYRKPNLEQLDYEEALSRFEALTKIGFIGKYFDKLQAEVLDDGKDSNSEARAQYSVELNVK